MYVFVVLILYIMLLRALMPSMLQKKAQMKFLVFSSIPIIVIMSLRYHEIDIVTDTKSYYEFYEAASKFPLEQLISRSPFEPGYVLLNIAFASIIPHPQFIFFLEAVICVSAVCRFIYKHSESPFLGMLFFVTLGTMTFEFTAFRQAIAMSVCLFAVEFIETKRLWYFLALVLFAATFHKTAIVFLPFYYLAERVPTAGNNIMTMIVLIIVLLLASHIIAFGNIIFGMEYGKYIGNDYGGVVNICISSTTLALLWINRRQVNNYLFINMIALGLFIYLVRYSVLAAERISFYFTTGLIVGLPAALESFKNREIQMPIYYFTVSLAIALFLYRLTYMTLADYRFFWEVG